METRETRGGVRLVGILALATCLLALLAWLLLGIAPSAPDTHADRDAEPNLQTSRPGADEAGDGIPPDERFPPVPVHGLVLTREDSKAIADATVQITGPVGGFEARTDSLGEWSALLPPTVARTDEIGWYVHPTYEIHAEAPGRVSKTTTTLAPIGSSGIRAPPLFLSRVAATVRGVVLDAAGRPEPGANVYVRLYGQTGARRSVKVVSGGDGRFGPVPVFAGSLEVVAVGRERNRGTTETVAYPRDPPQALDVVVSLPPPVYAAGLVVDERGTPVAGAEVRPRRRSEPCVVTDENGWFRWPLYRGAEEAVEVSREGYVGSAYEQKVGRQHVTTIVLSRAAFLSGRVVREDGSPATGTWVTAVHQASEQHFRAPVGDDGVFASLALLPGSYLVYIVIEGMPLGRFQLDLPKPGQRVQRTFRLSGLEAYGGLAVDALTGSPLAGVRVFAGHESAGPLLAVSASDGAFSFLFAKVLEDEHFDSVRAVKDGYLEEDVMSHLESTRMVPLGRVRLRAVGPDGAPVSGVEVEWNCREWPRGRPEYTFTDHRGAAEAELPASETITLKLTHPRFVEGGLEVRCPPGGVLDRGDVILRRKSEPLGVRALDETGAPLPDAWLQIGAGPRFGADESGKIEVPSRWGEGGWHLYAPGRARVSIDKSELARGPLVAKLSPGASVTGSVVDGAGRPVPGVRVVGAWSQEQRTDSRGRFLFEGLRTGQAVHLRVNGGPRRFPGPWCDWGTSQAWVVAGSGPATLTVPLRSRLEIRLGERPPDYRDANLYVMLMDIEDPVRGGPKMLNPPAWREPMVVEVPAGRLRVEYRMAPGAPRIYDDVIARPGETTVLDYDFAPSGPCTGEVRDRAGKPVENATILTMHPIRTCGKTDANGRIQAKASRPLPLGMARLCVVAPDYAPLTTELMDLGPGRYLEFTLERGGTVHVKLRRSNGESVYARVRARAAHGPHGDWQTTDKKGDVRLEDRLPPGGNEIEVRVQGCLPILHEFEVENGKETETEVLVTLPPR